MAHRGGNEPHDVFTSEDPDHPLVRVFVLSSMDSPDSTGIKYGQQTALIRNVCWARKSFDPFFPHSFNNWIYVGQALHLLFVYFSTAVYFENQKHMTRELRNSGKHGPRLLTSPPGIVLACTERHCARPVM